MWLAVALAAVATLPKDRFGDLLPPGVIARYGTNRLCYGRFLCPNTHTVLAVGGSGVFASSRPTHESSKGPGPVMGWDVETGKELFRAPQKKDVQRIEFDPAGRYWMEVLPDRRVRVVPVSGEPLGVFRLGEDSLSRPLGLVGERLAVTDRVRGDGVVRLQPADGKALAPPAVVYGMASHVELTHDGRELVAVSTLRGTNQAFDTTTGRETGWAKLPIEPNESYRESTFASDRRKLFVIRVRTGEQGDLENVIQVFDRATRRQESRYAFPFDAVGGRRPRPLETTATFAVNTAVSPDGQYAAWTDTRGQLSVRHLSTGRVLSPPCGRGSSTFAFAVGNRLAVLVNDTIALLDPNTGRSEFPDAPALAVSNAVVSPDGKLVAGGSDDGAVWVWDAATAKPLWHTPPAEPVSGRLRFDATGRFVVASGWGPTATVFDARTGARIGHVLPAANWTGTAVLDGGKFLLDVTADEPQFGSAFVRVRELATGKEVRRVELAESGGWQSSMQATVSADGKVIVLRRSSFGDLAVYDAVTGKLQRTLHLESGPYIGHVFDMTLDGRVIATRTTPSAMLDVPEELIAFDTAADRVLVRHPCQSRDEMFHAVAVSPDGRYAAGCIGKNGHAVILDLRNGAKVRELNGEVVAFFHDCRSVLTAPHIRGLERVSLEPAAWRNRPLAKPSDTRLSQLWKALGEPGEAGFDAVLELGRFPEIATPFLTKKMTEGVPDAKKLAELIDGLSAKAFADREAASKALREAGPGVVPALRAALKTATNPEARTRLEKAIQALTDASQPDYLRRLRAEEVLERCGK